MGSEARWNTVRRELKDRSSRVHVTSLPPYAPLSSSLRSAWSSFPRSLRFPRHLLPVVTSFLRLRRVWMEWVNDGRNEERTEWREWEETTNDHPTGHLLSVIPLPLMSVLTLPTSFLCSLSLLSRSLRLEVRFSLFTSHLSSDSEPRSGEQRRWVDRRRTDPRKLRQVVRILGLEVRLNGHEI